MAKPLPTTEYLNERLSYDPETGVLTWKERPPHHYEHDWARRSWNTRYAGKVAAPLGGRKITIDHQTFLAYHIIWCMVTGTWPKQLDHADRDPSNNRLANLREATSQQNQWNRSRPSPLPRGVGRNRNRFYAMLQSQKDGTRYLGMFATPEEAHAAWCEAAREQRGTFFRSD